MTLRADLLCVRSLSRVLARQAMVFLGSCAGRIGLHAHAPSAPTFAQRERRTMSDGCTLHGPSPGSGMPHRDRHPFQTLARTWPGTLAIRATCVLRKGTRSGPDEIRHVTAHGQLPQHCTHAWR